MVQGYDSRFGCERSRVQIPVEPKTVLVFYRYTVLPLWRSSSALLQCMQLSCSIFSFLHWLKQYCEGRKRYSLVGGERISRIGSFLERVKYCYSKINLAFWFSEDKIFPSSETKISIIFLSPPFLSWKKWTEPIFSSIAWYWEKSLFCCSWYLYMIIFHTVITVTTII